MNNIFDILKNSSIDVSQYGEIISAAIRLDKTGRVVTGPAHIMCRVKLIGKRTDVSVMTSDGIAKIYGGVTEGFMEKGGNFVDRRLGGEIAIHHDQLHKEGCDDQESKDRMKEWVKKNGLDSSFIQSSLDLPLAEQLEKENNQKIVDYKYNLDQARKDFDNPRSIDEGGLFAYATRIRAKAKTEADIVLRALTKRQESTVQSTAQSAAK